MKINVINYRGIKAAQIDADHVALVCGKNAQGKSSIAQAAAAVLSSVPFHNMLKKDGQQVVNDASEQAKVEMLGEDSYSKITWPSGKMTNEGAAPWASLYATGMKEVTAMTDKEKAEELPKLLLSEPSLHHVEAELLAGGFSEKTVENVWGAVERSGWDAAWSKTKEHTLMLKGKWNQIAGEKWGAKKALDWEPKGYDPTLSEADLKRNIQKAKRALTAAVSSNAVTKADYERLQELAEKPEIDLNKIREQIEEQEKEIAKYEAERAKMPAELTGNNQLTTCPCCEADLVVEHVWKSGVILKPHTKKQEDEAKKKEIQKKKASLDGKVSGLKGGLSQLENQFRKAQDKNDEIAAARKKIDETEEPDDNSDEIAKAEEGIAKANEALKAHENYHEAARCAKSISTNIRLSELLSPEGIRKSVLSDKLEHFNKILANYAKLAKWQPVTLDASLSISYGGRWFGLLSESEKWRTRTMLQIAISVLDNSWGVILDAADILDATGRNGLIMLLKKTERPAIVLMTVNKPELVPDLKQIGIGNSYWVQNGVVEELYTTNVEEVSDGCEQPEPV